MIQQFLVLGLCTFALVGCATKRSHDSKVDAVRAAHLALGHSNSNLASIQTTIDSIRHLKTSPRFWSDIANDPESSTVLQERCVLEMFKRFVRQNTTLSELAAMLNRPIWLPATNVFEVVVLAGNVPVIITLNDSVFGVLFPTDERKVPSAAYFRIAGKLDEKLVAKLLREGEGPSYVGSAKILEIGFMDSGSAARANK